MTSYMYVIELVYWSRCENRIQHENLFNKATNSHRSSEWDVNNNNIAIVNRWLHEVNQTSWVLTAACYTYGLSGWRYRLHVVRILTVHNTLPTRPLMLSTRSQPLAKKSSSERMLYSDIVIRNSFWDLLL